MSVGRQGAGSPSARDGAVRRAQSVLGIRNLVVGIHDAAFPANPGEDTGRGTPYGAGGTAFIEFARALGFDGVQLGPQGLTGPGNPSPYDGTIFSRNPLSIALGPLATPVWGSLLSGKTLEDIAAARPEPRDRVDHGFAQRAITHALAQAWARFRRARPVGASGALRVRFDQFRRGSALLERDAAYAALAGEHGGPGREWREASDSVRARRGPYAARIEAYLFAQFLAREQHRAFHERARSLGLRLWGDLQIGWSHVDAWAHRGLLLEGYFMGAPPSRTNPEGQPWGYPVLDPGPAPNRPGGAMDPLQFVSRRLERCFADYDGVRIDHPHGLVCPWVYRAGAPDAARAVREGARLFESPDLPDHPELAAFARVRPGQIRRELPRHADDWAKDLTPAQVRDYGVQLALVLDTAGRHGRGPEDVACEVLSTCPEPLRCVLELHGLGRFRVTQKIDLDDAGDVYRSENARPQDWIMLGNHDTPTIWQAAGRWVREGRAQRHAAYLAGRLLPPGTDPSGWIARVAADPRALAQAKFAELFVGPARSVMVFFTDLFGLRAPYNRPGTVHPDNWSARLGPDFREEYAARLARSEALDLPRAMAVAIRARGDAFAAKHGPLLAQLDESGGSRHPLPPGPDGR